MSYDRRTRDRFRVVVTGVTGGVGVAALTATGLLMGLASRDLADQQADQPADQPATQQSKQHAKQAKPGKAAQKPRLRQRPQVTRTTVRYVTGDSNAVGSGGAVTSSPAAPAAPAAQPAAQPAPAPAPEPAPEPAPAPSSGS